MHRVVDFVGGCDGAGERQMVAIQIVIGRRLVGEETVGIVERGLNEAIEGRCRVAIQVGRKMESVDALQPVQSPLEGTNHSIVIASGELPLPAGDPP